MADTGAEPQSTEPEVHTNKQTDSGGDEQSGSPTHGLVTANPSDCNLKKVDLLLKPTGDVPIMKKKKWQVDENKTVHWIISFIKRYLRLEDNETLFLYVAQAFAPSPDQKIKNLYDCFGTDGKLVLHYSKTPAWG
jgi:ubiquitin-like protein ATG12